MATNDRTITPVIGMTFDCVNAASLARFWTLALGYVESPHPKDGRPGRRS